MPITLLIMTLLICHVENIFKIFITYTIFIVKKLTWSIVEKQTACLRNRNAVRNGPRDFVFLYGSFTTEHSRSILMVQYSPNSCLLESFFNPDTNTIQVLNLELHGKINGIKCKSEESLTLDMETNPKRPLNFQLGGHQLSYPVQYPWSMIYINTKLVHLVEIQQWYNTLSIYFLHFLHWFIPNKIIVYVYNFSSLIENTIYGVDRGECPPSESFCNSLVQCDC